MIVNYRYIPNRFIAYKHAGFHEYPTMGTTTGSTVFNRMIG